MINATNSTHDLVNYHTGAILRDATPEEIEASIEAGPEGVIEVDGEKVYAEEK